MHPLQASRRHASFSSRASSALLDDAITPVDVDAAGLLDASDSSDSDVSRESSPCPASASASADDTRHLWRRMLALQRRYHCYKSARISAALESDLVEAIVPPRSCLDLLNDSITAQPLTDDARRDIEAVLAGRDLAAWEEPADDTSILVLEHAHIGARLSATLPASLAAESPRSISARLRARRRRRHMWRQGR